jgi:FkbM family methyltransferase
MDGSALRDAHHRRAMLEFYSQFIKKGDLCFDIGANIGKFTELFLKLGARVVCVEPQETLLRQLYKSFGNNRDVIIIDKAVGERESYGELMICDEAPTISTMSVKWKNKSRFSKNYKWTRKQKVSVTTLDTLIKSYGVPKFCKIDVEGFEESVLKGLTKRIPLVSFEFTREFLDDAKECVNYLLFIGYMEFNCVIGDSPKFLFPDWVTPKELFKKMSFAERQLTWGDIYAKSSS